MAGVLAGVGKLVRLLGQDLRTLHERSDHIVHGATVAKNALLERKSARVDLLTSESDRDVLEMREGLKPDRYNLRMAPLEPLVPRRFQLTVRERMRPDGTVAVPLDEGSVRDGIHRFKAIGVGSVVV